MHNSSLADMQILRTFLRESVAQGVSGVHSVEPRHDVTCVIYFFWDKALATGKWPMFEGALLETWRHCGLLKTVIVTNAVHDCLNEFVARFQNVEIQVEPTLIPGDINSMSIDCNSKIDTRFDTDYVLIVQDDGFPLRQGLNEFVEKGYDYIGSPYCRPTLIPNLLTLLLNFCPSNGGFSLRSRKFCMLVSKYWRLHYSSRPFVVEEMSEDLFCTHTLPRKHLSFWLSRKQAPSGISERFSYEGLFPLYTKSLPFGFHTATGFATLAKKFGFLERETIENF